MISGQLFNYFNGCNFVNHTCQHQEGEFVGKEGFECFGWGSWVHHLWCVHCYFVEFFIRKGKFSHQAKLKERNFKEVSFWRLFWRYWTPISVIREQLLVKIFPCKFFFTLWKWETHAVIASVFEDFCSTVWARYLWFRNIFSLSMFRLTNLNKTDPLKFKEISCKRGSFWRHSFKQ